MRQDKGVQDKDKGRVRQIITKRTKDGPGKLRQRRERKGQHDKEKEGINEGAATRRKKGKRTR